MRTASRLKGGGYLTSTVSVVLLAIPALKSASENAILLACLILGAASSILGMTLRWRSHRVEEREKERIERKADGRMPGGVQRSGTDGPPRRDLGTMATPRG